MDVVTELEARGIQPSAQRIAVAKIVLTTDRHPTAEELHQLVKARSPGISRATIYNTLNLFVEKGLVQALTLAGGKIVYDPKLDRHHHFIDDETGDIYDLPWDAFSIEQKAALSQFDVRDLQVVVHGKKHTHR
jgi:Fe2+ or Zn2+ uptake regulation protein